MVTDLIRRSQLASFFVFTFAITWIAFIHFYLESGETVALFTLGPFVAVLRITLAIWLAAAVAHRGNLRHTELPAR